MNIYLIRGNSKKDADRDYVAEKLLMIFLTFVSKFEVMKHSCVSWRELTLYLFSQDEEKLRMAEYAFIWT